MPMWAPSGSNKVFHELPRDSSFVLHLKISVTSRLSFQVLRAG